MHDATEASASPTPASNDAATPTVSTPLFHLNRPRDYLLLAGILGLMGAFFWAIRGTAGYGGSQGGWLAGLGWGLLWLFFSTRDQEAEKRPYATPWMLLAITFGIASGDTIGYDVYSAWVQGNFYLDFPEGVRELAPWTGYAMLFFSGLHLGGLTGVLMAWCGPNTALRWYGWVLRIGAGFLGGIIAYTIVQNFPHWFLPFYSEGIYDVEENRTCIRALDSIENIALAIGFLFGFLVFEITRRDWRAVGMILVMGLGFAIPFTAGGYWHSFHGHPLNVDWWKNWEMGIGLGGGLAMGLAFYLFNRPNDATPTGRFTARACIVGAAFPIWFALGIVFRNAFRGFTNIHELASPPDVITLVSMLYGVPATLLFAVFVANRYRVKKRLYAWLGTLVYAFLFIGSDEKLFQYVLPFAPVFILLLPRRTLPELPLPNRIFYFALAMIVAAGFIVSIHWPLQLYNFVLLICYTVYVLGSVLLYFLLLRRA